MFDGRWRDAVDRTTKPVGSALVRAGVSADLLTVFGLVMSVVTAFAVGTGRFFLGVALLFPTGLPDLFDGPVAKASGRASVRGAFFDSVADRIADAALFGGVAWYLAARHHGEMVLLPFAIVAVTSLISYQRAKADLLGISARGGLMERAERFIGLGVCFLAGGISAAWFVPALWVFLGLVTATALGRFVNVWRAAEGPPDVAPADHELAGTLARGTLARWREGRVDARWRPGRVDSRWRTWRETRAQQHGAGTRPLRRHAAQPSGRWRARRAGVPSSRTGRIWRARRAARTGQRVGRRPGQRGL
jgi:CDP-diacylglycerol--glycerol-3-phosphate 3-phosphatidyltransferase